MLHIFLAFNLSFSATEEKYAPEDGPPSTGYKSAVKFFKKNSRRSVSTKASNVDSGNAGKDSLLSLDTEIFANSNASDLETSEGDWGLGLSYYWDESWVSQGLELDYLRYNEEKKVSILGGLTFPRLQSRFPLYVKGNLGLGYFTGDGLDRESLSVDYNIYTGVRFFTGNMQFNIEVGSKNYTKLLKSRYLNSFVLASGLSVIF